MSKNRYHHGNLRAALLSAAAEQIAEEGADAVSLRALARRCGVSHAAPTHHFGDRTGLFTALAAQGFELLADALSAAGGEPVDAGLAYIRSALDRPGHFDVMFRHDLLDDADPRLRAARERAGVPLGELVARETGHPDVHDRAARLAAWSIAHGFAALWREGAFTDSGTDAESVERLARTVLSSVRFVPCRHDG